MCKFTFHSRDKAKLQIRGCCSCVDQYQCITHDTTWNNSNCHTAPTLCSHYPLILEICKQDRPHQIRYHSRHLRYLWKRLHKWRALTVAVILFHRVFLSLSFLRSLCLVFYLLFGHFHCLFLGHSL